MCHSIAGVGNKKGALDDVGARLRKDDIRQWIIAAPEMTAKTKAEREAADEGVSQSRESRSRRARGLSGKPDEKGLVKSVVPRADLANGRSCVKPARPQQHAS